MRERCLPRAPSSTPSRRPRPASASVHVDRDAEECGEAAHLAVEILGEISIVEELQVRQLADFQ
jgi:hypothetical protein